MYLSYQVPLPKIVHKKDYELIARVLKDEQYLDGRDVATVQMVGERLAYEFLENGYKFDKQKFLTACGIETEKPFCAKCKVWHHGAHIQF